MTVHEAFLEQDLEEKDRRIADLEKENIDVITHYSENKAYKNISVQYSVILRKE